MSPIQHEFTASEAETLICTAAELWASTGDPHDILGKRQKQLLARAHELLTEDDPDDGEDPVAGPASEKPATAFVIAHHDPVPFAIDEAAFELWLVVHADRVEGLLPGRHDRMPASDLVAFFNAAREADVLTEDPRLELCLDHDNTAGLPGFTLVLRNQHGNQDGLGLTTGFTELLFPDTDTSTAQAARFHLEHIIEVANGVLHLITGLGPGLSANVPLRQQRKQDSHDHRPGTTHVGLRPGPVPPRRDR
ncbi:MULTISPECIES: hypothetical protein [Nocardia]|uniref:hypothetical protein n=1 Tax=Nocardia TaxID=1817 RepID=UPI002453EC93|nr:MULTISPECIES: hypothetical protein [Nocardia]